MLLSIKNLGNIIPVIRETFLRFPLAFLCSISATLIGFLLIHDVELVNDKFIARCLSSLVYAAIALTALKLLAESEHWSLQKQAIGIVVAIAVIIAYVWGIIVEQTPSTYVYFTLAVVLSLLFSAYLKRPSDSASVWYFNYQNGVAIFFAGISAVIMGVGLSLILASIGYLFEIEIVEQAYGDVWVFSWGMLFPVYILGNIAKAFDYEDESCTFPKGVSFITNYLLVPLMFAYMFILYAYFLKIIIQWELPRGNLGWMITTFGTIGIITKLLAYPIRNDGTRFLRLFDRYYYYALIVPILLLAIAIGVRINDYGVTEQRYGVVLLGLWFFSVALLTFIKKDRFHIKHVPMILAALALLASIGPWGAVQVSLNSQATRFEALLSKHQLLKNGQAIKSENELSFEDRKTLSSIADYLSKQDYRLKRIEPLFKTLMQEAISKDAKSCDNKNGKTFIQLLGIEYVSRWDAEDRDSRFNYKITSYTEQVMTDISGFDYIADGHFYHYGTDAVKTTAKTYKINGQNDITVNFTGTTLTVQTTTGDSLEFDLVAHITNLREHGIRQLTPSEQNKLTLTKDSTNTSFTARLLLEEIQGNISENKITQITNVQYVLMVRFD